MKVSSSSSLHWQVLYYLMFFYFSRAMLRGINPFGRSMDTGLGSHMPTGPMRYLDNTNDIGNHIHDLYWLVYFPCLVHILGMACKRFQGPYE